MRRPAAPSHLTGVDEITRHEDASVNCSLPVVVVLSEYVPSELAVHVPVTWREPVTGADGHPAPTDAKSRSPVTLRHDDVTVQDPTTSPPHGATLEQAPAAPPLPERPPVATAPPLPELPPLPVLLPPTSTLAATSGCSAAASSGATALRSGVVRGASSWAAGEASG